jgi:hypothetical protein
MAKSYNEQLAEWIRQRKQSARHEKNRVAFLSVKDDVREALDQGWPVKTIWTHMVEQQRIRFGYDTFLVYVKRHVRAAAERAPVRKTRGGGPPPSVLAISSLSALEANKASQVPMQVQQAQNQLSGFTFTAAPNQEELI